MDALTQTSLLPELPAQITNRAYVALHRMVLHGRGLTFTELAQELGGARGIWSFPTKELEDAGLLDRKGQSRFDLAEITPAGRLLVDLRGKPKPLAIGQHRKSSVGLAEGGGTRYGKMVHTPTPTTLVLQPGRANVKLGHRVTKGRHKGRRIFSLTLEEGRTCPTCDHEDICYGGNMHLAKRWAHGPELEAALANQLQIIAQSRDALAPLIRLHVLGDFYSERYAKLWAETLAVPVFGFTHHHPKSLVGKTLFSAEWEQFSIRWSWRADKKVPLNKRGAVTVRAKTDVEFQREAARFDAIPCPVQTGRAKSCANCALCWQTERNIAFREH